MQEHIDNLRRIVGEIKGKDERPALRSRWTFEIQRAADRMEDMLRTLRRLRASLPAMDDEHEPQPGTDAVDALAAIWPEVCALTGGGGRAPKKGGKR